MCETGAVRNSSFLQPLDFAFKKRYDMKKGGRYEIFT